MTFKNEDDYKNKDYPKNKDNPKNEDYHKTIFSKTRKKHWEDQFTKKKTSKRNMSNVRRHVCSVNVQSSLHENVVFSGGVHMGNPA